MYSISPYRTWSNLYRAVAYLEIFHGMGVQLIFQTHLSRALLQNILDAWIGIYWANRRGLDPKYPFVNTALV